jgi:hypothetical protein
MTKLLITISFLFLVGSPIANAEQVYYCKSELNAGIIKDKMTGKWRKGNFGEERYTLKFNNDYSILEGISGKTKFKCEIPWKNLMEYKNYRFCKTPSNNGLVIAFNLNTMRFLYTQGGVTGYVEGGEDPDTNIMLAGTCEKF